MTETNTAPSPDLIVNIALGHMSAKQLRVAEQLGLFRALVSGPQTAAELAESLDVPERVTRILADAMNSLGVLERRDGRYSNSAEAAAFLTQDASTEHDLGPLMAFFEEFSYPQWLQFGKTAQTGEAGEFDVSGDRWDTFLAGVMNYNALHGKLLPHYFDLTPYRRMLDVGGLCEYFTLEAVKANPELQVDVVFDESFIPAITAAVESAGLTDRISITTSATPEATAEPGHDLVLLAHVIHRYTPEENARIFANMRGAAQDGATLLVFDFVLDNDEQQRPIDSWMAGEYLVIDGTSVYPEEQVSEWLESAGWRLREKVALPGSPRLLVADAI